METTIVLDLNWAGHPRSIGTALLRSPESAILIDPGPAGSVDDDYAHKPSVITHDGTLYHFYCAVSGKWPNDIRGISVARSKPW